MGGAFGHILHPHEDLNLRFSDIKRLISNSLSGNLSYTEKIDGLNLMVTWKENTLLISRNKGQLKNPITKNEFKSIFENTMPQNVYNSFINAIDDINIIFNLIIDTPSVDSIFKNGKRFINVEVVSKSCYNVINYEKDFLSFNGFLEYDKNGNFINSCNSEFDILRKKIMAVNFSDLKYSISFPNELSSVRINDSEIKEKKYFNKLRKIQKNFNDDSLIISYNIDEWEKFINKKSQYYNYKITPEILTLLIERWLKSNKIINITNILKKIDNKEFCAWVRTFDGHEYFIINKKINIPIENLFLELGADILYNLFSYNKINYKNNIKYRILDECIKIRKINNKSINYKLNIELDKINKMGGINRWVNTEGIIFPFNNNLYKFTGLFSSISKITGMLKFNKFNIQPV